MQQRILYVGLDVDDTQYHGSALSQDTGEILHVQCRPTLQGLVSQLGKLPRHFPGPAVHVAYEASYIGYTLQRDLVGQGYHGDVVAPASIPRVGGKPIKTDRLDAAQLAQCYANGLLTFVHVPPQQREHDRDLMRSRQHLLPQRTDLRQPLQALLRRNGLHSKAQSQHKSHWTQHPDGWLARTIESCPGSLTVNLSLLVRQWHSLHTLLAEYDQEIERLAKTLRDEKPAQALTCYKGIKHIFALTMMTDIGEIPRFTPPRQLVSWIGMDIREYSSGGNPHRCGITTHGKRYLRTAVVEANQRGYRTTRLGKDVQARRMHTAPDFVAMADRCLRRRNKQGNRWLLAGKPPNKGKVACAREMVGFVWESLQKAAAENSTMSPREQSDGTEG
jgi:transposase